MTLKWLCFLRFCCGCILSLETRSTTIVADMKCYPSSLLTRIDALAWTQSEIGLPYYVHVNVRRAKNCGFDCTVDWQWSYSRSLKRSCIDVTSSTSYWFISQQIHPVPSGTRCLLSMEGHIKKCSFWDEGKYLYSVPKFFSHVWVHII